MREKREVTIVCCEDNDVFLKKIRRIVEQFTLRNNVNASTHYFKEYDTDFLKLMHERVANRIYILDIETPLHSGKDIARLIRKFDYDSVIIFVSTHEYMANSVVMDLLQVLTFISKLEDCENRLKLALHKAMKILGGKNNFEFKYNGDTYCINKHDILYITYDSKKRESKIITTKTHYYADLKLKECFEKLDDNFRYSHRSCIVNNSRIFRYNHERIEFDNGEITRLVSKKFFEKEEVFV